MQTANQSDKHGRHVLASGPLHVWLLAGVFVGTVGGEDWPQWMGPNRDGVYAETGIVDTIPDKGLPVLWRQPIAAGYAGPAVANQRVFVTDYLLTSGEPFNDPGRRATLEGEERIQCFDAANGKLIWSRQYPCPYSISYPSGPRCTPTVDEDRVYCLGSEGDLLCLSVADGKVLWHRNFKTDFQAPVPLWGFSGHPLVEQDLVICTVGGPGQAVIAFDKLSGKVRWKGLDASAAGYCPPAVVDAGGTRQLIIWHADAIVGMNPSEGSVYWSVDCKPSYDMSVTRPQQEGDLLYVSGIQQESVMLRLSSDQPTVTELWRGRRNQAVYCCNSTPLLYGGAIYGTDCMQGSMIAVDSKTGERHWQTFSPTKPNETRYVRHGTAFITRMTANNRYLLFGETGELIIATMTPEAYREHGRFQVVQPTSEAFGRDVVWSHPAYANKTAFVRNDQELVAVDLSK